ncbi:C6 zinc finger domain protein [Colletotrichum higginsianum IMI 349063]|uniref:C6 zinc finger domain protein n=2 Tax=Colletotrichum higginsianum TaxID=80884 RepID=A0A1B7YRP7_COLHI|nr:C6 zinc finger domain protein [Colletotrichum higginsianum IMI 349063]OBR14706.1 C6 zinc finger domain protein [Colletotrichum higginsianum IMI 349063]TID02609.1 putative transcriptional regulatory protein C15D4.02 [Colletotrichum higginsianum]
MTRNGISRVKTGCITCKIRRVKCDEKRPCCSRCLSTGRKCDGYVSPPSGSHSWAQLLRSAPPQKTIALTRLNRDGSAAVDRAALFYHRVAAPALAGCLSKTFWTTAVAQVALQEPVAGHAVLALSSIFESFTEGVPSTTTTTTTTTTFAAWHYGEALRLLRTTRDRALVLFVCVLFIAIELLRKNAAAVVTHCRHGINILNEIRAESGFLRRHVVPVMRQLSIVPFFYGADPKTFPLIDRPVFLSSSSSSSSSPTRLFASVAEAYESQMALHTRLVRFLQIGEEARLAKGHVGPEPDRKWTRRFLMIDMDRWHESFRALKAGGCRHTGRDRTVLNLLEIRHIMGRVQISLFDSASERDYDAYVDDYRAVIDLTTEAAAAEEEEEEEEAEYDNAVRDPAGSPGPKRTSRVLTNDSVLEADLSTLLYTVVAKCRFLRLRLAALKLMEALARPRENVWSRRITIVTARRLIEMEHDISLPDDLDEEDWGEKEDEEEADSVLPPEERRVVNVKFPYGNAERRGPLRNLCFFLRDPEDGHMIMRSEWLSIEEPSERSRMT